MFDTLGHQLHRLINTSDMPCLGSLPSARDEEHNLAAHLAAVPDTGGLNFFLDELACNAELCYRRIARVGRAESLQERFLWHLSSNQTPWYRQGKVRSVFRQHIGRCLFAEAPNRLESWENTYQNGKYQFEGDIAAMEGEVSAYLCSKNRRFVWITGSHLIPMEHSLIGCLSRCSCNKPPAAWLGNHHPNASIRASGLWNVKGIRDACPTTIQSLFGENVAHGAQLRTLGPQGINRRAQGTHLIPFRRASFYPAIYAALQAFVADNGGTYPVGCSVRVALTPQGYDGAVLVDVTDNPAGFGCNTPDRDNRFPTWIKNAPGALYDLALFGCYRISHDRATGVVEIVRVAL